MSTSSKMNSADNLSIIHPDDTEHPTTPVSNMPFDESIEFRTSDCISPEAIDKINELLEISRLEREDMDAYDLTFQSKNFNEYSNLDDAVIVALGSNLPGDYRDVPALLEAALADLTSAAVSAAFAMLASIVARMAWAAA